MSKSANEKYNIVDDGGLIKVCGTIEHVIYQNDDNGYCICDICDDNDELITVLGTVPMVQVGEYLTFYGKWTNNPKYGRQFKVEQYERTLNVDRASVLRYLSSKAIKGIGPKIARRIVDEFGEESFDVIENHSDWLSAIQGISQKKAEAISEDFKAKAGMRSAMMYFGEFFGAALTVKIYKKWGSNAVEIVKQNPYVLCEEIDGIGFEKADGMAGQIGFSFDSEERLKSGLVYVLKHNISKNGHTCLPRNKLVDASSDILKSDKTTTDSAISALIKEKKLCCLTFKNTQYIYDRYSYECEKNIAEKLTLLDKMCVPIDISDVNSFLIKEENRNGISYALQQRSAISEALCNGVLLLTGGPGTGKTTVVKALLHIFNSMEYKVALAAPTGRAAKRLSESTQCEAKTIHRLLEMSYSDADSSLDRHSDFLRNEYNLLDENVIIIDEASMVDIYLMSSLLRAVKPGARIIIIGDVDQLPSVGPGDVLRDLIDCGCFSVIRLNEIFRQAKTSLIVTNAHEINMGNMPDLSVRDNDFFYLSRDNDRSIAGTIADLCKNRLPKTYGADFITGIQVISPSRKGEAGTDALNILLQSMLNPQSPGKNEYIFKEICYREGDKVMQIRNNYEIEWERDDSSGCGIFNGDIGMIESIDKSNEIMLIKFDDKTVKYDFSLLEDLTQAYAITVHKSQGSEYPTVIIPLYNAPPMLLTRNLLYTAVTRAQNMVILVGRRDIIERMIANNRQSLRYTGLYNRLAEV